MQFVAFYEHRIKRINNKIIVSNPDFPLPSDDQYFVFLKVPFQFTMTAGSQIEISHDGIRRTFFFTDEDMFCGRLNSFYVVGNAFNIFPLKLILVFRKLVYH